MAINSRGAIWRWAALTGLCLTVGLVAMYLWPRLRHREQRIYQALYNNQGPEVWWPPDWRRELRSSFLLEGYVYLKDGEATHPLGRPATVGRIELVSETHGRVFRTSVSPKGLFSFNPRPLPLGPAKIRLVSADGSATRWLPVPVADAGFHRLNFMF